MSTPHPLLPAIKKRFMVYKQLGDDTFAQLSEHDFFYTPSAESNSIAVIIQHLYGNAMSRFTNFLTEDGEKEWRKRDAEFEAMQVTRQDLLSFWNAGWQLVFSTIDSLSEENLFDTVNIRSEPFTVFDALLRQVAHYAYHVGQIVYLGKQLKNEQWKTLSIARGQSEAFNKQMKHQ